MLRALSSPRAVPTRIGDKPTTGCQGRVYTHAYAYVYKHVYACAHAHRLICTRVHVRAPVHIQAHERVSSIFLRHMSIHCACTQVLLVPMRRGVVYLSMPLNINESIVLSSEPDLLCLELLGSAPAFQPSSTPQRFGAIGWRRQPTAV